MTVLEVNTLEQLESLQDAWSHLLAKTPRANFFQSLDWLRTYWRHFGSTQKLRVLVTERAGEIVGIVPLVVRKERTRIGSLRYATYPLDYWGSFFGPIGANPIESLAESVEYLQTAPRDWDVFEPRWVGSDYGECERVEALLHTAGMSPVCTAFDSASVIALPGSCEEYLAARTSKWRNNRRRCERRLRETGDLQHFRYRPRGRQEGEDDPRWDLYDQCLRIAQASWQGSSETGTTLTHENVAPFLRDAHEAAARSGGLDLNLLYLDGQPIAFAYNYFCRGYVFGLRAGYDRSVNPSGAGNLLYTMAIEDSIRRGDWRYDLGPSHAECKRQLMTDVLPIYRLSCFRTMSLRQQLMRWKRLRDLSNASPDKPVAVRDK